MTYREYLTIRSPSLAVCQTRCGPYELLEPIGAGGMGAVYLARRSDGEVVQEVAVKILPLGEDDPDLRDQFLGERQILASLSHPNIARLLDAGHTPDGQPYLVMELVRGVTLDVFCRGLSVRARVGTFLSVCDAVAYAHRNLVVHRDLKPANILVDETGHPKLLDFGIARMVQHDTGLTLAGCRPLTPDYASPEQVSGCPPATATDIYSLGALLYKLLTGRSPHQLHGKSPEAMARAICHDEVIPASRFEPGCKGDLDAILGKALRKEPHERYSTVEQFADDLRDYLASRPIRLRQDEAFYRLRRFVRRHRRPVAAATVVLVGLGVGLYVAERQRAIADRRFQEVRALANRLFDIDESLRTLPGVSDARQMIVDTSLEYLNQLSREAAGDPALMSDLATAYGRTASVLVWRSPISRPNLQQARDAEEKASVLLHTALARNPKDRAIFRHFVSNQRELISAYGLLHQTEFSHAIALRLVHAADRFVAGSASPEDLNAASEAYLVAAQSPYGAPGADSLLERAISWRRRYAQQVNTSAARHSLAAAIRTFAVKLQDEGNLPKAADLLEEAIAVSREVPRTAGLLRFQTNALISLGTVRGRVDRVSLGDSSAAVAPLLAGIDLCRERMVGDPKNLEARIDFGWAVTILGPVYALRDPQRALDLYREAIRTVSAVSTEEVMRPRYLIRLWSQSAIALARLKRHEEARRMVARIVRQLREDGEYPIRQVGPESPAEDLLRAQAETETAAGNTAAAIRIREEMIRQYRALQPQEHAELAHALAQSVQWRELTYLYRRSDRLSAARDAQSQRLELWKAWDRKNPDNPFVLNQLAAARESDQF